MNSNKVCFIWNSDENKYLKESELYVDALNIPHGYIVEKIIIKEKNQAYGYNEAMNKTDAKYKVYLNERLMILNKNFLFDVLNIFKDDSIGMIGVLGAANFGSSGLWYKSLSKVGQLLIDNHIRMSVERYNSFYKEYDEVKVIDGSIMITQYDVKWREDIFKGEYFYDSAQCIEFTKKGYKIVVPSQIAPWCFLDCYNQDYLEFAKNKEIFMEEYCEDILPLVSILIPTYNRPEYFKIALESAINQSYRNIEIIVGDDSSNEETSNLIIPYLEKNKNIKYFFNKGPLGEFGYQNLKKIFDFSRGEYINILMDDDVFHYEKVEKMMKYYIENDGVTLVTSHRQLIDNKGNFQPDSIATRRLYDKDTLIDGKSLGKFILNNFLNIIGEPTTVLVRKRDIDKMFGIYMGRKYKCLIDISQWLELLRKGDAVYINQSLSYFRKHEEQNQNNPYLMMQGAMDTFNYIMDSYKYGNFIDSEEEYVDIIKIWLNANKHYLNEEKVLREDKSFSENEFAVFGEYLKQVESIISMK